MRQMTASELREIATDINNEINKMSVLETQIQFIQEQIPKNPELSAIFWESLALKLHNFYTGCERIFQIIASELNGGVPSGYDWHRRLLNRMTTPHGYRPPVLTSENAHLLEEYLAFRHVVRNIYGFELDPARVERLANNYYQTWLVFKQDLEIFTQWLEQLADNWEE